MPFLRDDERYSAALEAHEQMLAEEYEAFRQRLADRVVAMAAEALEGMTIYDDQRVRRVLSKYDQVYVEEAMTYIRNTLIRGGEIELAKRIDEAGFHIGPDDLPPDFARAYKELSLGAGAVQIPEDHPDAEPVEDPEQLDTFEDVQRGEA